MTRIEVFRGDITRLNVDAIVNAANEKLMGGAGVDGAIHAAAGPKLLEASLLLAPCPAGEARLTDGFDLPAKFVIHAVGPIYRGGESGEDETLRETYLSALTIAHALQFNAIAFPCISTGAYAFPQADACSIAIETVLDWQSRNQYPARVVFCCFEQSDYTMYTERLEELGFQFA